MTNPLFGYSRQAIGRRPLVCAGGAAAVATLLDVLLQGARPARAAPVLGEVPEVDRLSVRVVVDCNQIAVAPNLKAGTVDIQRFGWGLSSSPPGRTLVSEFGLSLHAQSQRGSEIRNVLVDFGYTPQALNTNVALLGIDVAALDAMVLSHGHYDHFGGLAGFLQQSHGKLKPGIPLLVGGEACFCARQWTGPPQPGDFGVLDRRAVQAANVSVTIAPAASLVAGHAFTTGQVPQTTFEKLLSPSKMTIGLNDGLGCTAADLPPDERGATSIPDQFRHEIATVYHLRGRGLVVLTSCSHRGIVNTVKQAQAVSGVSHVHAVIGGFHLVPFKEDYLQLVAAALKQIDPDYIIPLHCTGEAFWDVAKAQMPAKLLRSYTGTNFVFNA
jgi:7,8-dihydropterin-6-yl-methyl-4-(beta-D-ribofuranosyl)aminobenzene 5'-phosphate synthase